MNRHEASQQKEGSSSNGVTTKILLVGVYTLLIMTLSIMADRYFRPNDQSEIIQDRETPELANSESESNPVAKIGIEVKNIKTNESEDRDLTNSVDTGPWYQILKGDLVRTNADSGTIAKARDIVISKHQNFIEGDNGSKSDPTYSGSGRAWFDGKSFDESKTVVVNNKTQITDKKLIELSIQTISATDSPSLVFINYHSSDGKDEIVTEFVSELEQSGVKMKNGDEK